MDREGSWIKKDLLQGMLQIVQNHQREGIEKVRRK